MNVTKDKFSPTKLTVALATRGPVVLLCLGTCQYIYIYNIYNIYNIYIIYIIYMKHWNNIQMIPMKPHKDYIL